jgi:hypothetical protein
VRWNGIIEKVHPCKQMSMNWGGKRFPFKYLNMFHMILMEGGKEKIYNW